MNAMRMRAIANFPKTNPSQSLRDLLTRLVVLFLALQTVLQTALQTTPAWAGEMLRDVEWVRPRIGQRGTTLDVIIQGRFLNDPKELIFYKPGIRCTSLETLPKLANPIGLPHGGRIEEQLKATLEIAPDCEPGEFPFRLRTAQGLSLLSTFHVSPFPIIPETSTPNNTLDTAQDVPLNTTVIGDVDVDCFRVRVRPRSRLSVEVDCVRIADLNYGDSEFDLAIRLLDSKGRELGANDENALHVQDPLLSIIVPESLPDDFIYVEVRQSVHSPRNIPYALHIGDFARPLAAYPAGGHSGQTIQVQLIGDPTGTFDAPILIPKEPNTFPWFGDAPSPLSLRSCPYGNILEDRESFETRVPQLPMALNGIIDAPGDVDRFRVQVRKGDRYRVRVYGSSLGHAIDPSIRILAAENKDGQPQIEIEADDADPRTLNDRDLFGSSIRSGGGVKDVLDPSVIWEPKSDGEYWIEIRDTSNIGGPASVYRIEVEPPPDTIYPVLTSRFFDWVEGSRATGLAVPKGNRWTVLMSLPKGQGTMYADPYDLIAEGLPPGVRMVVPQVPAQANQWPVQLVADNDAREQASLFSIRARSPRPDVMLGGGCQQVVPFINHSGGDAWRCVRVDRFAMAITEAAPFSIDLAPPTVSLVRGGELFIPVKLTRRAGFQEPIEFQADFGPPGVGLPPKATMTEDQSEAMLRITASKGAAIGKGWLYVMASTLGGSDYLGPGRVRVSSELIQIDVAEPYVELASEPTSVRRGGDATVSFAVTSKSPFDGEATVQLLGLPKGVHLIGPPPKITKDAKQIEFKIAATDEALLGPVNGLECELIIQSAGQEIRQRAGNGTLRIDPKL